MKLCENMIPLTASACSSAPDKGAVNLPAIEDSFSRANSRALDSGATAAAARAGESDVLAEEPDDDVLLSAS